ncbi:MAG TPA: S26 family signal peptidase [Candidatus Binataceae bacterium]|nr:S26 family signal peptidase [Candidatus Binataceae bacterium]
MTYEQTRNIYLIVTTSALAIILFLLGLRYFGVTGALTDSEPWGFYRVSHEPIRRGGMVELRSLIKHIAAVPGDTVRVTPEGSYVNGKLWPDSGIPVSAPYRPFPYGTYTLAPGQYWILGHNPASWDSRYIGMIPRDLINTTVKPLLTFSNGYAAGTL